MKTSLRFMVHAMTPLEPFDDEGKYIGKNPITKISNDLIIYDYHDLLHIKSDGFVGDWFSFQKNYNIKGLNLNPPKPFDLKIQKKLYEIDTKLTEIENEIKKLNPIIQEFKAQGQRSPFYYYTVNDSIIKFSVSEKHTAHNPKDENIVYEDSIHLHRREEYFFKEFKMDDRYKKETWSAITYYLYENCSYEDIICINNVFLDQKTIVQYAIEVK